LGAVTIWLGAVTIWLGAVTIWLGAVTIWLGAPDDLAGCAVWTTPTLGRRVAPTDDEGIAPGIVRGATGRAP
ncbi:MAG: hypothetical protein RIB65_02080, partial [Ilumatobacter fluminis]